MPLKVILLNLYYFLFLSFPAFAEENQPALPENSTFILPWASAGIDAHFLIQARPQLEAARMGIIKNIVENPRTLKEVIESSGKKSYLTPHDDFFRAKPRQNGQNPVA